MDNITQDKEIVKGDKMSDKLSPTEELKTAYKAGKKCKWTPPNGPEYECKPSLICGDCEYNTFKPIAIKYEGHEFEAIKDGIKYKSTDGKTWISDSKTGYVLTEHDYTKIQNYIEAIRLIAEKIRTAESDCIEQLARDVGNYLYDLVNLRKGE